MSKREQVLQAAAAVLRDRGIAHTTTKEIAAIAECSEGTIYNHFADKQALLVAVASQCLPSVGFIRELPSCAGQRTVRDNLEELATVALAVFSEVVPIWASVLADPDLLAAYHRHAAEQAGGPDGTPRIGLEDAFDAVADYVAAEQALGRIAADARPRAVAELILGACHSRAFLRGFALDPSAGVVDGQFVRDLVATLLAGPTPSGSSEQTGDDAAGEG